MSLFDDQDRCEPWHHPYPRPSVNDGRFIGRFREEDLTVKPSNVVGVEAWQFPSAATPATQHAKLPGIFGDTSPALDDHTSERAEFLSQPSAIFDRHDGNDGDTAPMPFVQSRGSDFYDPSSERF